MKPDTKRILIPWILSIAGFVLANYLWFSLRSELTEKKNLQNLNRSLIYHLQHRRKN